MKYPKWTDFFTAEIMYGFGPIIGIGFYTIDGKFCWPDRVLTTKREYDDWVDRLTKGGYEIPDEYKNAYSTGDQHEPG